jgi:hypothetical protein
MRRFSRISCFSYSLHPNTTGLHSDVYRSFVKSYPDPDAIQSFSAHKTLWKLRRPACPRIEHRASSGVYCIAFGAWRSSDHGTAFLFHDFLSELLSPSRGPRRQFAEFSGPHRTAGPLLLPVRISQDIFPIPPTTSISPK